MRQSKKISNWSELCPDLLRNVFECLSFTNLNRVKSVCSLWYYVSRSCVPKRNQIPWLILFPHEEETNNSSSCMLFIPDDRDKFYKTRDLGVDFFRSHCLATYGSWLLMKNRRGNLNILNPLTGERLELPVKDFVLPQVISSSLACLWIDERSKDYLVVLKMRKAIVFTKKGSQMWERIFSTFFGWGQEQMVYEHKAQKLYIHRNNDHAVMIYCFSGIDLREEKYYAPIEFSFRDFKSNRSKEVVLYLKEEEEELYVRDNVDTSKLHIVLTLSGEVLKVASRKLISKEWVFDIYKINPKKLCWEKIDYLGDEALILDMGIAIATKDISEIKRNSIYFSGFEYGRKDSDHIFVFDLTTHKIEPISKCIFFSTRLSYARWFFPSFSG